MRNFAALVLALSVFLPLPLQAQSLGDVTVEEGVREDFRNNVRSSVGFPGDQDNTSVVTPPVTGAGTRQVYNRKSARDFFENNQAETKPLSLMEVKSLRRDDLKLFGEDGGVPFDIRKDALREAAVSYGARAGLAWRTDEIRRELDKTERYMDKTFDFRSLLIPAPSGFMIEPPIVTEALNNVLIETDGRTAAVTDKMYNIINNVKIVSAPRTWRTYLLREWGEVEKPPNVLLPETDLERAEWEEYVTKGWYLGVQQANEVFQEDVNKLVTDFEGMVRYRMLLAQNMISPPFALQVDRGVTGGGDEMRIGDRAIAITGVPELISGTEQWQPVSR